MTHNNEEHIESANEYQIILNVIHNTTGLKRTPNWCKVQSILLCGTSHDGMTSSIQKAEELGVDPYGYKWIKEKEKIVETENEIER